MLSVWVGDLHNPLGRDDRPQVHQVIGNERDVSEIEVVWDLHDATSITSFRDWQCLKFYDVASALTLCAVTLCSLCSNLCSVVLARLAALVIQLEIVFLETDEHHPRIGMDRCEWSSILSAVRLQCTRWVSNGQSNRSVGSEAPLSQG